jgi:hypothetical protein
MLIVTAMNAAPLPVAICMIGCGHTTQQAAAGGKAARTQ